MRSKESQVTYIYRGLCLLLAVWLLCPAPVNASGESDTDGAKTSPPAAYRTAFSTAVDGLVDTTMLNLKIPSVTVAVLHNGTILHTGAYGLEHIKHDEVPTTQTVYLLDSLSKQFTAAGIMLLVQDGKIDLDKPVKTYIPYAPARWNEITIRHLLTHTSGLPHDPHWGYPSVKSQDKDPDRLLRHHIFNQRLRSKPGQKYAYSNTGYAALGALLSKVSQMPYSTFMANRIFKPLQMNSTGIDFSGARVRQGARGYDYDTDRKDWKPDVDANQPMAAGAIESNVLDLAKWDQALNGTAILTDASKNAMWTSSRLSNGKLSDYGFGWGTEDIAGQKLVSHDGGGWGFNSAFYRYLGTHLTIIVLSNLQLEAKGTTHADQLAMAIAAIYSPDLDPSQKAVGTGGLTAPSTPKGAQTRVTGDQGSRSAGPGTSRAEPQRKPQDDMSRLKTSDFKSEEEDQETP